jgi:universal stress protein A
MKSIKKILLPVDFSEVSQATAEQAQILADATDAEVEVLHVIFLSYFMMSYANVPDRTTYESIRRDEEDRAQRMIDAFVTEFLPEAKVSTKILVGHSSDLILEHVRQTLPDMVIIGLHGRKGLAKLFIGSVAERIIQGAGRPVLVVHPSPEAI